LDLGDTLHNTDVVIPTAILAGFLIGLWLRWWAVPIVGVGWAVVILFIDPSKVLAGGILGALNGFVGVLAALGVRRLSLSPSRR
jgi:hypothetical protein